MCEALARNAKVTCLDLSYNNFAAPAGRLRALEKRHGARALAARQQHGQRRRRPRRSTSGVQVVITASQARPLRQWRLRGGRRRARRAPRDAGASAQAGRPLLELAARGRHGGDRRVPEDGVARPPQPLVERDGRARRRRHRRALGQSPPLQFLDVSSNRIPTEGAVAIAAGLAENATLRSLSSTATRSATAAPSRSSRPSARSARSATSASTTVGSPPAAPASSTRATRRGGTGST